MLADVYKDVDAKLQAHAQQQEHRISSLEARMNTRLDELMSAVLNTRTEPQPPPVSPTSAGSSYGGGVSALEALPKEMRKEAKYSFTEAEIKRHGWPMCLQTAEATMALKGYPPSDESCHRYCHPMLLAMFSGTDYYAEVLQAATRCPTYTELRNWLNDRFVASEEVFKLQKKLETMKQGRDTLKAYCDSFKKLLATLTTLGKHVSDEDALRHWMNGLNEHLLTQVKGHQGNHSDDYQAPAQPGGRCDVCTPPGE